MPHVSVTSYDVTASSPFNVTIAGLNTMLHPTVVWLTKSDFGYMAGALGVPDSTGKWTTVFPNVPAGAYVYYAQCGQDDNTTGNINGSVPKSAVIPEAAQKMAAAVAPAPGATLADYYPRHVSAFGFGPKARKPLAFGGFVTASAQQPGPLTPLVCFIPSDKNPAHFKFGIAAVKGNHWYHDFGAVATGPAMLRVHFPDGSYQIDLLMEIE